MKRRSFVFGLSTIIWSANIWSANSGWAEDEPSGSSTPQPGSQIANLEQTLKSGLRARRELEFDFIHEVVLMVKAKQLPIDLVQSTFLWARRHRPYPYPYFERGLRERAQKIGITI